MIGPVEYMLDKLCEHRRLVRELDVALCGSEGASKQASLCDLVEPVRAMRRRLERMELVARLLANEAAMDTVPSMWTGDGSWLVLRESGAFVFTRAADGYQEFTDAEIAALRKECGL